MASALIPALRQARNLAVMGFGDLSTAAQVFPALSTVRIDGAAIGASTAEALLARFNDAGDAAAAAVRIDKGFTIVERQSA